MKNPFVSATIKALSLRELAKKAAILCFNFGLKPRNDGDEPIAHSTGHNKRSKRRVAYDKRSAIKRRNVVKFRQHV